VLRWRELRLDGSLVRRAVFTIGVLTTFVTVIGWSVNLVAKPYAPIFGGGLTAIGLVVGFWTYRSGRRQRPAVFPVPYRPELAGESIAFQFQRNPADVPSSARDQNSAEAVIELGCTPRWQAVVFLYRGQAPPGPAQLWEVSDPYLKDYVAQDAFTRAEVRARKEGVSRRYVYVPGSLPRDAIGRVWAEVHPHETVVMQGEQDVLPPVALDRIRHRTSRGVAVLHLVSSHVRRLPEPVAS
jgi:hypothetical protein